METVFEVEKRRVMDVSDKRKKRYDRRTDNYAESEKKPPSIFLKGGNPRKIGRSQEVRNNGRSGFKRLLG